MLLHDVSQTALAAAVLTLGLVILLALRSFTRLRRSVDINLGRVFEQLEMLRAESRKMLEAQQKTAVRVPPVAAPAKPALAERQMIERPLAAAPPIDSNAYLSASTLAAHGLAPAEIAARCGLQAGEARLLASLASASARRDQAGDTAADAIAPAATARNAAAGSGKV